METSESQSENWVINCSDDELAKESDDWEPTPQEIFSMYGMLESNGVLELDWQCPGRRSPSVNSNKSDLLENGALSDDDSNKQTEPNEFDFDDEFSTENSTPKISRKRNTNATSAQRRVARLDKVMFDIQRHRKLDELELQKCLTNSASSTSATRAPSQNEQKT